MSARVRRKQQDVHLDVSGQQGGNTRSMLLHRQTVECFGGRRRGLVKAVHYIATGPRRAANHYLSRSLGWCYSSVGVSVVVIVSVRESVVVSVSVSV